MPALMQTASWGSYLNDPPLFFIQFKPLVGAWGAWNLMNISPVYSI